MQSYDETVLAQQCERMGKRARTAFAAACAERLWPLVERYASARPLPPEQVVMLRAALDAVWAVVEGQPSDVKHAQEVAEGLVPDGDSDWIEESGYAIGGIAAVAYAARSWLTDDPQEAVWAARQVYVVADYEASRDRADGGIGISDASDWEMPASVVIQAVIRGIADDLSAANSEQPQTARESARSAAVTFSQFFA